MERLAKATQAYMEEGRYWWKHKNRFRNMKTTFYARQEPRDGSIESAKLLAKCWKKAGLKKTKIHIRRNRVVVATIENFEEWSRFIRFAAAVNKYNARRRKYQQ